MPLDSEARPQCVVVSIEAPWPVTTGGRARTSQAVRQLALHYDVTVIFPAAEIEYVHDLPVGVILHPVLTSLKPKWRDRLGVMPRLGKVALRALRADLLEVTNKTDPLFIYWSHSYLAAVGMAFTATTLNIVEFANIESERSLSVSRSTKKLRHRLSALAEFVKGTWWEPRCAKRADLLVSLHHSESAKLRRYNAEVLLVPNGFEQRAFTHSPNDSARIFTMGSWTYEPNREGLEAFIRQDWPAIVQEVPQLELVIAGNGANALLGGAIDRQKNVTVLGFVEDTAPFFRESFCFLAPAATGGGSQLKVAEALSFCRHVVGPEFLRREVTAEMPKNAVIGTQNLGQAIIELWKSRSSRGKTESEMRSYISNRSWEHNFAPVHAWVARSSMLVPARRSSTSGR